MDEALRSLALTLQPQLKNSRGPAPMIQQIAAAILLTRGSGLRQACREAGCSSSGSTLNNVARLAARVPQALEQVI